MKLLKTIGLWFLVAFFAILALGSIPSFACFPAIVLCLLVAPIEKWQSFLKKYVTGKIKTFAVILLAVLTLIALPNADSENTPAEPSVHTIATTESSLVSSAPTTTNDSIPNDEEASTEITSEPTSVPTTTPSTAPATTPTTALPTEPTTAPTTAPSTEPTTAPTTEPSTEPTTAPTTEPSHTHSFSTASCTEPRTCSCGETEGTAKGHSYANGICSECGTKDPNYKTVTYVLNTSSKKFHLTSCSRLPTTNRQDTTMTREEIISAGYEPCGYCHP